MNKAKPDQLRRNQGKDFPVRENNNVLRETVWRKDIESCNKKRDAYKNKCWI